MSDKNENDKPTVLDGLAWASLSEQARVARISAQLVRKAPEYGSKHTKTFIKETVRKTCPPRGRGKYVFEAVLLEYERQRKIYGARQKAHADWKAWQHKQATRETRLNNAYAYAFHRPRYQPRMSYPGGWGEHEARRKWEKEESARDTGDKCIGLTHFDGHVVALVESEQGHTHRHVATINKDGEVTRTYLHSEGYGYAPNLVAAAMSLGGPKVRSALSIGKKVITDWTNRRTFVHHEGQDHVHPHVEEIPWRAVVYREEDTAYGKSYEPHPVIIRGEEIHLDDGVTDPEWNDCD
jgi:hypothetical protein